MALRSEHLALSTDISTRPEDTLTGDAWLEFLASARSVIGVESGSSVLDRRGEIRTAIERIVAVEPEITFEEVAKRLPAGWDSYTFFALGPRHFEPVITRTAQLLVEGSYEGVLVPDRHYLSLKRDWSNVEEVLARSQDPKQLQELVDCSYEELYISGEYSYRRFAQQVADAIESAHESSPLRFSPAAPIPPGAIGCSARASDRIQREVTALAAKSQTVMAIRRHVEYPGISASSSGSSSKSSELFTPSPAGSCGEEPAVG